MEKHSTSCFEVRDAYKFLLALDGTKNRGFK